MTASSCRSSKLTGTHLGISCVPRAPSRRVYHFIEKAETAMPICSDAPRLLRVRLRLVHHLRARHRSESQLLFGVCKLRGHVKMQQPPAIFRLPM